jgi:hypothetical protein
VNAAPTVPAAAPAPAPISAPVPPPAIAPIAAPPPDPPPTHSQCASWAPAHATGPVGVDIIRNASQGERVQTQRQSRTPFETPRLIERHHVSLNGVPRGTATDRYHERFVQRGGETVARAVPLGIDRLRQPDTNASAWLQYQVAPPSCSRRRRCRRCSNTFCSYASIQLRRSETIRSHRRNLSAIAPCRGQ